MLQPYFFTRGVCNIFILQREAGVLEIKKISNSVFN